MLPSMALAVAWDGGDPVEVHRLTYEHARAELAPEVYRELTAPGVREARAQDPAAFHEHLAFFRARVLYTLPVFLAWKCGAPLSAATWWVSLGAYVLCALVLLAWASRHLPLALAALFALGLAHTPALLTLASLSTADGVAALLVVGGAALLVEARAFWPGALVLVAAVLARPDAVILAGCLALALFAFDPYVPRPRRAWLGGFLAASALVYLGVQCFAGEYGWWPLFTISFEEKAVHPASLPDEVDWPRYREVLAEQVSALPGDGYVTTGRGVTGSTLVLVYAAFALAGLALWRRRGAELARPACVLLALLATYLARFLLFPQIWDRFFAPFYALVPLLLLAMASRATRTRGTTESPRAPTNTEEEG
jgi:hypothetical protein